jgi:phage terminase large subunit-like protein
LTPEEEIALRRAFTPRLNKFISSDPHTKQSVFLLLNDVLEVLFGGAAGPGKSVGLLMGAAQFVDVPGYAALLLRRSYRDLALPGALMHMSHQWWDHSDAHWDGTSYKWTFPSGAVIQFGYMEHDGDEYRYQSSEYQFIGFDELTQFKEHQYTYMFSRLRKVRNSDIPLRMRSATNPGGVGHEWVKDRFNLPSGITGNPSRVFVPARLEDNPHLDIESYEEGLSQLADVTHAQLREGDWDATISGGKFYPEWFTVIDRSDIPKREHWRQVVRHWDLGSQAVTSESPDPDYTAGCKMILSSMPPTSTMQWHREANIPLPPPPYYIVSHVNRFREDPGGVEEQIASTSAGDGYWIPVSIEQERGASGKGLVSSYRRLVLPQTDLVIGLWAKGGKEDRARIAAGRAKEGRVFVVDGPWRVPFINELALFGVDGVHDDQVDAFSGCFGAFEKLRFLTGDSQARQH